MVVKGFKVCDGFRDDKDKVWLLVIGFVLNCEFIWFYFLFYYSEEILEG